MAAGAPTPQEAAAQAAAAAAAARKFNIEAWTLLAIGLIVTMLRTYARVKSVGFKKLEADDYLAWFAATCYAVETSLAYSVGNAAHGLANNGMTDQQRLALSPSSPEYGLRVLGSKIQLAGWTTYGTLLWSLKASLLVFYLRLTAGLDRHYEIRIFVGSGLVALSYVVIIMNLYLACRPFHLYWQINPDPGNVCQPAVSAQVVWVYLAFNVITDLYLLSIPLPMLWKANLKPLKKVGLMSLFSGGIFVIACATLRCVLIVTDPVNGAQLAGSWAVRETFVAVITTNLPMIVPLVNKWLVPYLGALFSTMRSGQKLDDTPIDIVTFGGGGGGSKGRHGRTPLNSNPMTNVTFSESEERMVEAIRANDFKAWNETGLGADSGANNHKGGHQIQKQVEVAVISRDREGDETEEDQQRQRAISSIDESAGRRQGHFAFARGPSKANH